MSNQNYHSGIEKQIIVILIVLAGVILAILFIISFIGSRINKWLNLTESNSLPTLSTETQPGFLQQQPQVVIATSTSAVPMNSIPVQSQSVQSFEEGSRWIPYICNQDIPVTCLFVQSGQTTGYWAECNEPTKFRPTYYQANPVAYDWYEIEKGVLVPVNKNGNLQSFRFLSQGERQPK